MTQDQIPGHILSRVEDILGAPLVDFENQTGGFSQGAAARVRMRNGRRAFLKTIGREGFEGTYKLYLREHGILAAIPEGIRVPRLIEGWEEGGWVALLIEDVDGRHPSTVGEMLAVLDSVLMLPRADAVAGLPDASADLAGLFVLWESIDESFDALTPWAAANLARLRLAAEDALDAVAGDDLVHSDLRPDNVLIDGQGRAWLVDWPWASRGAKWYDALLFVLDCAMNMDGVDAESVLASHPVFAGVSDVEIDSVLAGFAGYYVHAAVQPAVEVPQSLRVMQRRYAQEILGWLERRWSARDAAAAVTGR